MKTSSNGRKFIEGFEGLILQAYDDHNDHIVEAGQNVVGTLTIGYGHTDAAGPPKVFVGQKLTQLEADNTLASDLTAVEIEVSHLVKVPLNQDQYDALVSFQFNTGKLGQSTLLKELNEGNYTAAADQFLVWNHVSGVVVAGLTRRRTAERAMFLRLQPAVNTNVGAITTSVVIAAGTGATAAATGHDPLIFLGIVFAGFVVGCLVHWYINRKVST